MISSATAWGSAVGTGTTGPFAIPFPLYSQTHLTVLQVVSGVVTTLALGTAYTFTAWTPDNKGQVQQPEITFTNAVAGGTLLIFLLILPGTQLTAFTSGPYSPGQAEAAEDLVTQLGNMLMERVFKSVRFPDQEYSGNGVSSVLPPIASRALTYLACDSNGNIICVGSLALGAILAGYAFASLPTPQTQAMFAQCTDGPLAFYNTVLGAWEKIDMVSP